MPGASCSSHHVPCARVQVEVDEKTLRKEISFAIKNIHGLSGCVCVG